jgi:hypothetical protein
MRRLGTPSLEDASHLRFCAPHAIAWGPWACAVWGHAPFWGPLGRGRAPGGTRTPIFEFRRLVPYPVRPRAQAMVGTTGFEPATSTSQTSRSTKLSYVPPPLMLSPQPTAPCNLQSQPMEPYVPIEGGGASCATTNDSPMRSPARSAFVHTRTLSPGTNAVHHDAAYVRVSVTRAKPKSCPR